MFLLISFIFFSLEWNNFPWSDTFPCKKEICLSKKDIIQKTTKNSLENKLKFESLYRSWQNIRIQWGRILPHINFDTIAGCGLAGFFVGNQADAATQLYSNFLGFLYPSRWFRWKESKMHYQAEKYSYFAIKAYSINIAENIYYELQREILNEKIMQHYLDIIQKIIAIAHYRFSIGLIPQEEIISLNSKEQMLFSQLRNIQQNIQQHTYALLAHMSYDPTIPWTNISIELEDISVPNDQIDPNNFKDTVLLKSLDIKSFDFLYKASRYAFKAKKWDFISPMGDESMAIGFSRGAVLKTSNSYSATINLEKENIKVKTIKSLYSITNYYNFSLLILKNTQSIFDNLQVMLRFYKQDFEDTKHLDLMNFLTLFQSMLEFDLLKNTIIHMSLIAKSNFRRLTLEGSDYDTITSIP